MSEVGGVLPQIIVVTAGMQGADGAGGGYMYVAYADDAAGAGFTTTFNSSKNYIAFLQSPTFIDTPLVGDFNGLWKNYKGATGATGATGAPGAPGADGTDGTSVPTGGTTGQILKKNSNTDYDFVWDAESSSSLDWINVKDYGAIGDGVADDTTAIQAALDAAIAGSGVCYFPAGVYNFTSLAIGGYAKGGLTLRGSQGYQWWGDYGGFNVLANARLNCIRTDDTTAITCFPQVGLLITDLEFTYDDGFEGILLNIGGAGGAGGSNTVKVSRCHFVSDELTTYMTAFAFIGMNGVICTTIEDCTFAGAQRLIIGQDTLTSGFTNDIYIERCSFGICSIGQIVNPGIAWCLNKCTFEGVAQVFGGGLNDMPYMITSELASTYPGYYPSLDINQCQFWDNAVDAIYIYQPPDNYWDLKVRNCWFHTTTKEIIKLDGIGYFIFEGNHYEGGVPGNTPTLIDLGDAAGGARKDLVRIEGNNWTPGSGDRSLTVKNWADHGQSVNPYSVSIRNNSDKGSWSTDESGGNIFIDQPVAAVLGAINSGNRYRGGTFSFDTDSPVGCHWEFLAVAYYGLSPVITIPAGTTLYLEDQAATGQSYNASARTLTLTRGVMRIHRAYLNSGGFAGGVFIVEIHGTYTLV